MGVMELTLWWVQKTVRIPPRSLGPSILEAPFLDLFPPFLAHIPLSLSHYPRFPETLSLPFRPMLVSLFETTPIPVFHVFFNQYIRIYKSLDTESFPCSFLDSSMN